MSNYRIERNPGEIKVIFTDSVSGKVSFKDLGFEDNDLVFAGGNIRMVFNFDKIDEYQFYQMPTLEISYREQMGETHWVCDYNKTTILDKTDHHGRSTVLLMNRKKIDSLEQHHQNRLIIHADFPKPVHLIAKDCFVNFFN